MKKPKFDPEESGALERRLRQMNKGPGLDGGKKKGGGGETFNVWQGWPIWGGENAKNLVI